MEKITLEAKKRELTGKKVKQLRSDGLVPAVLYGEDIKPVNLSIDEKKFEKVFEQAGTSALVDLKIDDQPSIKTIICEPQIHPVTDEFVHVDFHKIKMTEKLETEIPLEFIGESLAVKDLKGNFITNKDHVQIECLPGDLIPKIDVDISVLKTFEDKILVKDLNVPSTIKILDDAEDTIALVAAPISEEELKAMEEETAAEAEKAGIEKMETEAQTEKAAKEGETAEPGEDKVAEPKPAESTENKPTEK
jgi:large subunit ribosomal protein L25